MPSSEIDLASRDLKTQFLDGWARPARNTILGSATKRQFAAKSVAIKQGRPADHLFLLTKGYARHFYVTEEGKRFILEWLGPGDLFGARTILSTPTSYLASTEM